MEKLFILLLFSTILFSCNNSNNNSDKISTDIVNNPITKDNDDTSSLPVFKFKNTDHDFGIIIQGEKVSYTYKFKNVGGSNLIISSAHASCGCTIPKYTKKPIAPGEDGEIEVIFDSSGRNGMQHKTVTIMANSQPSEIELSFTAEVVNPEKNQN